MYLLTVSCERAEFDQSGALTTFPKPENNSVNLLLFWIALYACETSLTEMMMKGFWMWGRGKGEKKTERASVSVQCAFFTFPYSDLPVCHLGGRGGLTSFSPPNLVYLTCLLTSSYQRQKPSRAKNFPCYCACKTPGRRGPLRERCCNQNTQQTLNPVEGLPAADEKGM